MEDAHSKAAVFALRTCLTNAPNDPLCKMLDAKEKVLGRYGAVFAPSALPHLTADEFRSFLYLENNCHWSQLYRRGLEAADDIETLRQGLSVLLDESRDIVYRWNQVQVKGLGKAIKSAILLVTYPDRYGVWNTTSEKALRQFGLFPTVFPKQNKGKTYEALGERLNELAKAVGTDLWTLDGLFWAIDPNRSSKVMEQLSRL